jgi:two-component system nitrogen regulation sensor histidine kinase NtrY
VRLAPRLVLAFSLVAIASTIGLGVYVRRDRHQAETDRFDTEVKRACDNVATELGRQAERDDRLIHGACESGELVDRVMMSVKRDDLGSTRLGFAEIVPKERVAFDLDELMLVMDDGDVLGADPSKLRGSAKSDVMKIFADDKDGYSLRTSGTPALVSRCTKKGTRSIGLVGARHMGPQLARLGKTLDVRVNPASVAADEARAQCTFSDARGKALPLTVTKSKAELAKNLERVDEAILLSTLVSIGASILIGIILARSLGGPIAELSRQARKVATDEAVPIDIRGTGEVGELVLTFNKMIEDLAVTRRRLAAASRVAAWREVARRVAHEIKNPLAPIRAAVETLRRLRARQDPAFDEYFDEATRTVLDEVHRISNIVTEFTRFARLPQPKPAPMDVDEVVRHVVSMHKPNAGPLVLRAETRTTPPKVNADRDQIVQILTNLVQNAIDAARNTKDAEVTVVTAYETRRANGPPGDACVTVTVADNGPGIAPEMEARLFEPYATSKAHGTGLGLAIAQRIAMEHGGELVYAGRNGARGAVFRLTLTVDGPPPLSEGSPSSG